MNSCYEHITIFILIGKHANDQNYELSMSVPMAYLFRVVISQKLKGTNINSSVKS